MPPALPVIAGTLAASSVWSAGITIFGTTIVAAGSIGATVAVGVAVTAIGYAACELPSRHQGASP